MKLNFSGCFQLPTQAGRTAGLVLLLVLEQSFQTSDVLPAVTTVPYTNSKRLEKRPTSFQHDGMTWIGESSRA